jgi:hypothetical protein
MPRHFYDINMCKFTCKLRSNIQKLMKHTFAHCAKKPLPTYLCLSGNFQNSRMVEQHCESFRHTCKIICRVYACALTDYDLFLILLGRQTLTKFCNSEYMSFRMPNNKLVQNAAALYNTATSFMNTFLEKGTVSVKHLHVYLFYVYIWIFLIIVINLTVYLKDVYPCNVMVVDVMYM